LNALINGFIGLLTPFERQSHAVQWQCTPAEIDRINRFALA
jgi:hypothetical protein